MDLSLIKIHTRGEETQTDIVVTSAKKYDDRIRLSAAINAFNSLSYSDKKKRSRSLHGNLRINHIHAIYVMVTGYSSKPGHFLSFFSLLSLCHTSVPSFSLSPPFLCFPVTLFLRFFYFLFLLTPFLHFFLFVSLYYLRLRVYFCFLTY
jgi:hypothetical protein